MYTHQAFIIIVTDIRNWSTKNASLQVLSLLTVCALN